MRPSSCDHLSRNGSAWAGKSGVRRRTTQRHPASEPVILTRIPGRCPKFEHHDALHEPTLIAAARSQMTASSPRGTFSQAELTAEVPLTDVSPAPDEPGSRCRIRTAARSWREEHTRPSARPPGGRTGLERHLDGGGHELRGFRVDDDVPGLLHPAAAACFPGPAAGAGLGRLAGRTVPARRDQPAAGLYRQPVPATLTTTPGHSPHQGIQEAARRSGAHVPVVTGTRHRAGQRGADLSFVSGWTGSS